MNKIVFDKVMTENPERFPFVTIEEKVPDQVPERGKTK